MEGAFDISSVSGNTQLGWECRTLNAGEVIDEVQLNEQKIEYLTGRKPRYLRSGTAYYDEVAVKIVYDLGLKPIGFNILGDAGANFNTKQVANACLSAVPGSIMILHINHPEKYTDEGIKLAIPELKKRDSLLQNSKAMIMDIFRQPLQDSGHLLELPIITITSWQSSFGDMDNAISGVKQTAKFVFRYSA